MRAMAFGAIEPGRTLLFGKMFAGFELRELRVVTGAAHRPRRVAIRFAGEVCRMGFRLLRLRGIAAVAVGATDAQFAVRARPMAWDDLSRAACWLRGAVGAVVVGSD